MDHPKSTQNGIIGFCKNCIWVPILYNGNMQKECIPETRTGTNPATLIDRDDATQIKQLTSMDEEATDLFSD